MDLEKKKEVYNKRSKVYTYEIVYVFYLILNFNPLRVLFTSHTEKGDEWKGVIQNKLDHQD